ncbi:MAG: beta-ketoacyl synthase N-terminal-like domain-containing protein [Acutalibacteraceae bacterium]|nr:beta-ketoacyl synthase N-terminal-like domain-containing protein [Acutalibacteraceae bacterium]
MSDANVLIKQSIDKIKSLKKQLEKYKTDEKIAVIGMACRFPGGCDTPDEYWQFLKEGKDAAIDIPADRWDINEYYDVVRGIPGKMYVKKANFLKKDVSEFDAKFFKISPAEANAMDPQQRQLLEVSWEALENAGKRPDKLVGSKTGVFIGINSSCEYAMIPRDKEKINQYIGTGTISSIAAGRISYVFGFNGPTLSLDTACSSSLVSTLLAVDSLRNGSCEMALAGGVSLMLSPTVMSSLCMMNSLSESGKSAPFDASGDGYGRGEGCGILVLKRLSDAKRDKDKIYAVICGGAINNDGASSGLTVPNGNAQRIVIEDALKNCERNPNEISYLETHGTGTSLGDPIEVKAIQEVFGETKRKEPLILGAVKGNIGHLESAAGVASLIKVVLSLYHKEIVPVSNYEVQNPRLNLAKIPAVIPQGNLPWKTTEGVKRVAGVSSFGFSGTNAHVIVEEADPVEDNVFNTEDELEVLTVSAKDKDVLSEYVNKYFDYLKKSENIFLSDICYTANACRTHFSYRKVFCGKSKSELCNEMEAFIAKCSSGEEYVEPITTNPKLAYLLTGEISELKDDAKYLIQRFPKCKEYRDQAMELFKSAYENCTFDVDNPDNVKIESFAIEYAVYQWLKDMGIAPEIVAGVGVGAYVAAVMAGILSVKDAIALFACVQEGKDFNQLTIDLQRPKCRFVSVKEGKVIQNVTCSDIVNNFKVDVDSAEVRDYLYQEGYRYFVEFGKIGTRWNEKQDVYEMVLFKDKVSTEIVEVVAACFEYGTDVDFTYFYETDKCENVILPNYPFVKNKYWVTPPKEDTDTQFMKISKRGLDGKELFLPYKQKQIEYVFNFDNFKELKDNSGVVHVGYYMELLTDMVNKAFQNMSYSIVKMEFASPIILFDNENKQVLLSYEEIEENRVSFVFYSKNMEAEKWQKNVYGELLLEINQETFELKPSGFETMESTEQYSENEFYDSMENHGYVFGKAVRWVENVEKASKSASVKFRKSEDSDGPIDYALKIHPGIIDSCAQVCNFLMFNQDTDNKRYMISSLKDIMICTEKDINNVYAIINIINYDEKKEESECSLQLLNESDKVVLEIQSVKLKSFDEEKLWKLANTQGASSNKESELDKNFMLKYSQTPKSEKLPMLIDYIKTILAKALEMNAEEIGSEENIDDLGMDSMVGLEFHANLSQAFGVELSYMDLIEGGTCKGIAELLIRYLPGGKQFNDMKTENKRIAYDQDLSIENWIYEYKENPKAKLRLFCFPYGFGSANMFKDWQNILGEEIDVCAIKIPGLDIERMREMAPDDIDDLMETFNQVIEDKLLDIPCATFGHSWGSLFSYRCAYRLFNNPKANLVKCFVAGYTSPSLPNTSLYQILDELEKLGYDHIPTEQELRESNCLDQISIAFVSAWGQSVQHEEYAISGTKASLPLITAAYRLIERFNYNEEEKFNVPIVGFQGLDDYRVPLEDMNAWTEVTSNTYEMYTVPGDHGFIVKEQSEARVLEIVNKELDSYIK